MLKSQPLKINVLVILILFSVQSHVEKNKHLQRTLDATP